jgi:hypothetical protein
VQALVSAGQGPRFHQDVPLRLLACDRDVAFVAIDPANTRAGAYVVKDPGLIGEAVALFEDVWANAVPAKMAMPGEPRVGDELTIQVLRLLTEGLKDDAIARRLGLSDRTVRRVVAQLLEDYDATSRFQLAVLAAQDHHLPIDPPRR